MKEDTISHCRTFSIQDKGQGRGKQCQECEDEIYASCSVVATAAASGFPVAGDSVGEAGASLGTGGA